MNESNDVTSVCINPHIVGWYLFNELKQLKQLKQHEEEQLSKLSQTNHPIYAKTISDIYYFATRKKDIDWPIRSKLQDYIKSLDADPFLTFEDIVDYFEEQLTALNAKKTIDKVVVDAAYTAHEHAEKNHSIDATKMGKRLFKPVASSNNSTVTPTLNVTDATFIPLSQSTTALANSKEEVNHKIVKPTVVRFSLPQDLIHSSEPIENSRLYRFWLRPDTPVVQPNNLQESGLGV